MIGFKNMAELPELLILARQMTNTCVGETISGFELRQPKCLNAPEQVYRQLEGQKILSVEAKGKWLFLALGNDRLLLLNVGMGADVLYYRLPEQPPAEKYQCRIDLAGGAGLTVRFWWFGNLHLVARGDLSRHPAGQLGPTPWDPAFTVEMLEALTGKTRRNVKSLITDQKVISGIGNAYVHDILFLAGIHPLTPASQLTSERVSKLHSSMREGLTRVLDKQGLAFERDIFGKPGGFEQNDFLVGYHQDQPCIGCGTPIQKIKAAGSASYVCSRCQAL
jgi:formamidopyrimidine-DNA glycosylase